MGQVRTGKMVQQVIQTGLRLNFTGKSPTHYREKSSEFGIGEVLKLLTNCVIEVVGEDKVICINPMSVASNQIGKRRLCIDLLSHVNDSCTAKNLKLRVSPIL